MDITKARTGVAIPSAGALLSGARRGVRLTLVAANVLGLVVLVGMLSTYKINDDLTFEAPRVTEGGLKSVDMAAALVLREVEDTAWVPNDPAFLPGAWLRNMKAFQEGLIYSQGRFANELADTLGRSLSATAVDPDLDRAAGLLRFPATVWRFDFEKSWAPTITSEAQYSAAARALYSYNERLANGRAVFDPRPDNLATTLERIEADISSKANNLIAHVERQANGLSTGETANSVFFATKGRLYGYLMVLSALGEDFADVIDQAGARLVWDQMISSLEKAAVIHPVFLTDSPPGHMIWPSHTCELGVFTLRVQTQLRDVLSVLRDR